MDAASRGRKSFDINGFAAFVYVAMSSVKSEGTCHRQKNVAASMRSSSSHWLPDG
jgi:hypothetical protein